MKLPIVLAITGASGVIYGQRLLKALIQSGIAVELTISDSGRQVLRHELHVELNLDKFCLDDLLPGLPSSGAASIRYHHYRDFMSPIASGSYRTRGMVVCPCSGSTLSGIACAASGNLVQRAADVHLKEKRPLIIVPRETPLSSLQLQNMLAVANAGGTVLPASPGFYHGVGSVSELVDFVVARILDHLHVEHQLVHRWGES
jgi:4-hydroxy-3-polyprenylbenzoate decarboxylase